MSDYDINRFTGEFDIAGMDESSADARYVKTVDLPTVVPANETDPLSLHLDQTTPQTVINGAPTFSDGANFTNAGDVTFTGTGDIDLVGVNIVSDSDITADAFITVGGASTDFVKGDGSLDASTYLTAETDPVFSGSDAASITSTDITNLGNLSGTNSGDQVGDGVTITGAGTVADPFVSAGGSSDHSALSNLDYASAGHTGFQPTITAGTYLTPSSIVSYEGDAVFDATGEIVYV